MTRFHVIAIATVITGTLALASGQLAIFSALLLLFATGVGLGIAFPQLSLFGPFVCWGKREHRCVALTFDDGPDPRSTPALLDLLRSERVAAVFFGIGQQVTAAPELAARIVREGHLLENHSYAHSNATNFFTVSRLQAELSEAQVAIQSATGIAPKLFRPPMGLSNPRVFRAAQALGLKVIGWSARGLDTQIRDPERIVARICRRLAPGAIILLHDGNIPADRLVVTVKLLLAKLKEQGYEIVRLDNLLA